MVEFLLLLGLLIWMRSLFRRVFQGKEADEGGVEKFIINLFKATVCGALIGVGLVIVLIVLLAL